MLPGTRVWICGHISKLVMKGAIVFFWRLEKTQSDSGYMMPEASCYAPLLGLGLSGACPSRGSDIFMLLAIDGVLTMAPSLWL